jgi:glycopeptide antibiotics resistance protein
LRALAIGCVVVVVLILVITVSPEPVDRPYHAIIRQIVTHVRVLPGLQSFDYAWLERLSNVVMFVPLGALLELLLGVRRWWLVLALAAAFSSAVELVQLLWLPDRTASVVDVLANTIGAGCGAALSALVTAIGRLARRRRVSE